MPRPSPLSLSLMESLWEPGGCTDLACRRLGIPYDIHEDSPPYVTTLYGALYVNQLEGRRRIRRGPGAMAAFRLTGLAESIDREFMHGFLPGFLGRAALHEAVSFERLPTPELLLLFSRWVDEFARIHYLEAEIINVAADFYWKSACRTLAKRGLEPLDYLTVDGQTVVHRAMAMLPEIKAGSRAPEDFLQLFGHRAPADYELQQPRYGESDELLQLLIERSAGGVTALSGPCS